MVWSLDQIGVVHSVQIPTVGLISHLYVHHAWILATYLAANCIHLQESFNPYEPIESLYVRLNKCDSEYLMVSLRRQVSFNNTATPDCKVHNQTRPGHNYSPTSSTICHICVKGNIPPAKGDTTLGLTTLLIYKTLSPTWCRKRKNGWTSWIWHPPTPHWCIKWHYMPTTSPPNRYTTTPFRGPWRTSREIFKKRKVELSKLKIKATLEAETDI